MRRHHAREYVAVFGLSVGGFTSAARWPIENEGYFVPDTAADPVGARKLGVEIDIYRANSDAEIKLAFAAIARQRPGGLIVAADPFFDTRRSQLVMLAAEQALPAIYQLREYAVAGGLISYGIDLPDIYRQVGDYTGKLLKGARPADLPVVRPTRFELVINLKTAKALDLTVPQPILAQADKVIE
jgi:putative ABC transport system substrate-binding protein